jgi:hypothetical protein
MEIRDIGLTLDNIGDWRKLRHLEQRLEVVASLGFRLVELDIAPFHLIANGEIHRPSLDDLVAVLSAGRWRRRAWSIIVGSRRWTWCATECAARC